MKEGWNGDSAKRPAFRGLRQLRVSPYRRNMGELAGDEERETGLRQRETKQPHLNHAECDS